MLASLLRENAHEPELFPNPVDQVFQAVRGAPTSAPLPVMRDGDCVKWGVGGSLEVHLTRDDDGVVCPRDLVDLLEGDRVDLVVHICALGERYERHDRYRDRHRHGMYLRVPEGCGAKRSVEVLREQSARVRTDDDVNEFVDGNLEHNYAPDTSSG